MTTLDEIEARVKRETDLGATEWLGPSARAVDLADVSLLIRAVRQLGGAWLDNIESLTKEQQAAQDGIDPDVLEFINE
jgi:hypothetical protein